MDQIKKTSDSDRLEVVAEAEAEAGAGAEAGADAEAGAGAGAGAGSEAEAGSLHAGEVRVDAALVKRLLAGQFPQWVELPLVRVKSTGTDNAIYRLGDELSVRLPRIESATGQAEKELHWLPKLAPYLPLAIPTPIAIGEPAEGYPWQWAVYRWFSGVDAIVGRIDNLAEAAKAMAQFVAALHRIDPTGGPLPAGSRRDKLAMRDELVLKIIADMHGEIDHEAAADAWSAAMKLPEWQGEPVWIHGDLHAGNLLIDEGRLTAVIDFGCIGVGDPAYDMLFAWSILDAQTREIFRAELQPDEQTWVRGKGFALSMGLIAYPYYKESNPLFAGVAKRIIDEVLADYRSSLG
ncbi:aminoglycoside phosphotransferase family protein [Paenibacillus sp. OV219]|uniref:aminoglycoside phosphotransferase family protein n=1 Tax=Paenibacillus sp. OV219 TaxID=1884377 RepID=UPI0008D6BAB4|nr:aminoglycoside phosphotransferase family protein [Paenibacillus sp. OV219]SEO53168.1 Predicted kinase, aminoglycoside phosphotransferase (APT) family [Paenibacillus sp. OV219]